MVRIRISIIIQILAPFMLKVYNMRLNKDRAALHQKSSILMDMIYSCFFKYLSS